MDIHAKKFILFWEEMPIIGEFYQKINYSFPNYGGISDFKLSLEASWQDTSIYFSEFLKTKNQTEKRPKVTNNEKHIKRP